MASRMQLGQWLRRSAGGMGPARSGRASEAALAPPRRPARAAGRRSALTRSALGRAQQLRQHVAQEARGALQVGERVQQERLSQLHCGAAVPAERARLPGAGGVLRGPAATGHL